MMINIGLWRRGKGNKYESKNVQSVEIAAAFGEPKCTRAVLDYINANHPGWHLTGYVLTPSKRKRCAK